MKKSSQLAFTMTHACDFFLKAGKYLQSDDNLTRKDLWKPNEAYWIVFYKDSEKIHVLLQLKVNVFQSSCFIYALRIAFAMSR